MNTTRWTHKARAPSLIAAGVALALLGACSSAPTRPEGAQSLRASLNELEADAQLAGRAPLAIKDAELAVIAAEQPESDQALVTHRLFMAERKIAIARAQAQSRLSVDQRQGLSDERDALRLQARTDEADAANQRAAVSQADASQQKQTADVARNDADAARNEADAARNEADAARSASATDALNAQELQRQIDELQAKATDHGLVLTLGDVNFASGRAELTGAGDGHLAKLAGFLNRYPERTARIEGYTDSVGGDDYNQGLSQRRADGVKAYLVAQGVESGRLTATGRGESSPIGDNGSATGRQQNRRVEVVIEEIPVASR